MIANKNCFAYTQSIYLSHISKFTYFIFYSNRQISKGEPQENPTETKKKKKKGDDDKGDNQKDDVEPVAFFKMFRYSTTKDKLLYCLGFLCAIATGLTTPANSLIFGNLANVSI